MFGIGFFELVVIAVVALVFIGPKRLPDFMKQAGKIFVQVRRTANDVRSTFDQVVRDAEHEIRREETEALKTALGAKPVTPIRSLEAPDLPMAATPEAPAAPVEEPDPNTSKPHDDTPTGAKPYAPDGH
jgi:sec-independent protein translocase protein TatB